MWWLVFLGVVLPLYYDYECDCQCDCECDCECACECDDRNKNNKRNKAIEFRRTVPSNASWASGCLWVKALAGDFVGVARSIHAYHGHLSCTMQLNLQKWSKMPQPGPESVRPFLPPWMLQTWPSIVRAFRQSARLVTANHGGRAQSLHSSNLSYQHFLLDLCES